MCVFVVVFDPGAVLFPTMYDMWVAMLKSPECGCLSMIGLQRDDDDGGDDENQGYVGSQLFFGTFYLHCNSPSDESNHGL